MKKIAFIRYCSIVCLLIGGAPVLYGQSYSRLWKQVEQAQEKSLPKTVVALAEQIFRKGAEEQNAPQMLKAYTVRSYFQQQITPDSFYVDLQKLEQWAVREPNAVNRAVLHSMLADYYADFATSNRWQLRQRTDMELTDDETPADIRQWSSLQFADKVLQHINLSLADPQALLQTSSKNYTPFVIQGDASQYFTHDMYHLLARRAVSILNQTVDIADDIRLKERLAQLNQEMTDIYRQKPGSEDALLLVLMDQPHYTDNIAALDSLITLYGSRDVCAELYIKKAQAQLNVNKKEALQTCDEGIARYPKYNRIGLLKNIRQEILEKSVTVRFSSFYYPGDVMPLEITHRNTERFTLKLNKNKKTWLTQEISLKPSDNYNDTITKYSLTAPSQPGTYTPVVVIDKEANANNSDFIVTRLKAIVMPWGDDNYEVRVVDFKSGQPVEGAKVEFTRGQITVVSTDTTNADGKVYLKRKYTGSERITRMTVSKGNDRLPSQWIGSGSMSWYENSTRNALTLLTDRSIYRPGQTIYIKGIAYAQSNDTASILADKPYTVQLRDANRKEIASKEVRTGDFGSFISSFTLPTSCLNGTYTLMAGNSSINVRVEEYKRPSFEVVFDTLKSSYQLGDTVRVSGKVTTYSGVPVQDAVVHYKIDGGEMWFYTPYSDSTIQADSTVTDSNGLFSFPAVLKFDEIDEVIDEHEYRYYLFDIEANVTNEAGETQSAQKSIYAGNRSLQLSFSEPNAQLCKEDTTRYRFEAKNLNGQEIDITGSYKLTQKDADGKEQVRLSGTFKSNRPDDFQAWKQLASGEYKLEFTARDDQNREVKDETDITIFSLKDKQIPMQADLWRYTLNDEFDATHPARFAIGTSLKDAYVQMDLFCGKERIESRNFVMSDTQLYYEIPYKESYGDGVTYLFSFVQNGKLNQAQFILTKRMETKTLPIKWSVFRDKLRPGQQEEWRFVVRTPQGTPADAEVLATMYDASLDQIYPNNQQLALSYNRAQTIVSWREDSNSLIFARQSVLAKFFTVPSLLYDYFYNSYLSQSSLLRPVRNTRTVRLMANSKSLAVTQDMVFEEEPMADNAEVEIYSIRDEEQEKKRLQWKEKQDRKLRTNFAETAFFYPQLRTNEQGEVVVSFTLPESLTRWNFRGYAHTRGMLTGMLQGSAIASKEFMLQPNLPRFVRVGDETHIAAIVTNLTEKSVTGKVHFELFDLMTDKVITRKQQSFKTDGGKSTTVNFGFTATDKYDLLGVRMVADGGDFSDGEQHLLPVLSNKIYLTETVTMPIRGNETRTFALDSLFNRNSRTATRRKLTVEFTGNPAWLAIQALPTLTQPTRDNATAWATTWYANAMASYVLGSTPRIKTVLDSWKQTDNKEAFMSTLQKNQELKNIVLEESPWLLEATTEAEQRARLTTLFDVNNLTNNNLTALNRLQSLQNSDGSWSWYKGMPANYSMTNYIVELLTRITTMTEQKPSDDLTTLLKKAFGYLHTQIVKEYNDCRQAEKNGTKITVPPSAALEYLYLIAVSGEQVPASARIAYNYFLVKVPNLISVSAMNVKALAAVILLKVGKRAEATAFTASLKEHLVQTDERGAYFAFYETPYLWGMLPVSIHTRVMEALQLEGGNDTLLSEMKIWLLKQKQATSWDSPVATADAVYALFAKDDRLLTSRGDVRITLDKKAMQAQPLIPELGYIKETFAEGAPEVKTKQVTVEKPDEGIAYGAVYAQYLSPIVDLKGQGGELAVEKQLFVERTASDGQSRLLPVTPTTKLAVGDKVTSRLTLRVDRAMDFVQLKDQRGACFEPIGALSGYVWRNRIGYYVEIEDAATNFFFDRLAKGVYVLEYSYRIARSGKYVAGIATLQSAYAPEYAAHSASQTVQISGTAEAKE
ncbi:MAG: alpha-2-macroglobulin [Mediterranea sp.]|nr:alpha-2-macroglobulin [Mediterranea sp.]